MPVKGFFFRFIQIKILKAFSKLLIAVFPEIFKKEKHE